MAELRPKVGGHTAQAVGWLASAPAAAVTHLGYLRERSGIEVYKAGEQIWLRGPVTGDGLDRELRSILGCRCFGVLKDGQIVRVGAKVPCGRVPVVDWQPLRQWLKISLPTKRLAASSAPSAKISLVRSSSPKPTGLLRVSRLAWRSYAQTAPQVRLQRLVFAANEKGATSKESVVVVGQPLPPIPAEQFSLQDGIAAPVGFAWRPAVDARVLGKALGLEEGDVALLLPEGGCTILRSDQFVGATRSAVRLTEGAHDALA